MSSLIQTSAPPLFSPPSLPVPMTSSSPPPFSSLDPLDNMISPLIFTTLTISSFPSPTSSSTPPLAPSSTSFTPPLLSTEMTLTTTVIFRAAAKPTSSQLSESPQISPGVADVHISSITLDISAPHEGTPIVMTVTTTPPILPTPTDGSSPDLISVTPSSSIIGIPSPGTSIVPHVASARSRFHSAGVVIGSVTCGTVVLLVILALLRRTNQRRKRFQSISEVNSPQGHGMVERLLIISRVLKTPSSVVCPFVTPLSSNVGFNTSKYTSWLKSSQRSSGIRFTPQGEGDSDSEFMSDRIRPSFSSIIDISRPHRVSLPPYQHNSSINSERRSSLCDSLQLEGNMMVLQDAPPDYGSWAGRRFADEESSSGSTWSEATFS